MNTREQLHQQYDIVHQELLKYLDISHLGKLDIEEDILIAAVKLTS